MTACGTTEVRTEYVKPTCSAPPQPSLPKIDAGELWDSVGQRTYDVLMDRDRRLVDWAFEMESMINVLCEAPENESDK